ncbi:MAG: hypothetical protein WCP79_12555 [Bacillota bacterium]
MNKSYTVTSLFSDLSETCDLNQNYILISLLEQPFKDIVSGKKIFEYRTRYSKVPTTAFIYVSRTLRQICGIVDFDSPIIGTSEEICALAEKHQPGSSANLMAYFKNGIGYAIPVKSVRLIETVDLFSLRKLFPGFVAPQSYYLLNNKPELLKYLLSLPMIKRR